MRRIYDNELTALSPEFWVAEGLRILRQALVIAPLFSTDYRDVVAKAGQIVHVHKRGELYARRKLAGTNVVAQDLSVTGQSIRLNQQPYVHYSVDDIDQALSMGDVVQDFIEPGFFAIAQYVDVCCAMQCYDFFRNQVSGSLANSVSYNKLVDANRIMNTLKVPRTERGMVINSMAESALLKEDKLTRMDTIGSGAALLNGVIGGGAGFSVIPSLNMPMAGDLGNAIVTTGAIDNAGGYTPGTTDIAVDGITGTIVIGTFCTIECGTDASGVISVHQVTAQSASNGNTIGLTIVPGIVDPVLNNADITFYTPGTVTANKAEQYAGLVRVTMAGGQEPVALQGISFAADGPVYGILSVTPVDGQATQWDLELHRPLDEAITTANKACLFPPVALNWSFTRDSSTIVSRPLRIPRGAASAAMGSVMDLAIRVVIGYNQLAQEELVTADTLFGIKTLDTSKGMMLIG